MLPKKLFGVNTQFIEIMLPLLLSAYLIDIRGLIFFSSPLPRLRLLESTENSNPPFIPILRLLGTEGERFWKLFKLVEIPRTEGQKKRQTNIVNEANMENLSYLEMEQISLDFERYDMMSLKQFFTCLLKQSLLSRLYLI